MYGTVARLKLAPGAEAKMTELMKSDDMESIDGVVSTTVYKLDSGDNVYIMSVVFESKEKYVANAESPEMDARYQQFRALLVADPEWMDGEIVYHT